MNRGEVPFRAEIPSEFRKRVSMNPSTNESTRDILQVDKYLWLNLLFVFAYIFIAQAQNLATTPLWCLWTLFGFAALNASVRTFYRFRKGDARLGILSQVFVTTDILLLSIGIFVTSGLKSDLWLIYFIAILSHSLYVRTTQVVFISSLIALSYPLATLPSQWGERPLPWTAFATTLCLRLFFIFIVGTYTRRIWLNEEARAKEVQALREGIATGEERSRIAREIHDGLGHSLVSAILRLELCQKLMKKAPDEAEAILKEEIPALREAWNEGRDMAFHLRSWESEVSRDEGFETTLRKRIGGFAARTGLQIELKVEGRERNLSPAVSYHLTRMAQESLTNILKHAHATSAVITLTYLEKSGISCVIRDNGVGIDPMKHASGMGLQSIQERLATLGGKFAIRNREEGGAEVIIEIPKV